MIFGKAFDTWRSIRKRQKADKERIKKQKKELGDLLPFEASIGQGTKLTEMIYNLDPTTSSVVFKTDEKSESLINEYIYTLLDDFVVEKDINNNLLINLTIKEV